MSPPIRRDAGCALASGLRELEKAGATQRPGTVLADAGYWHKNWRFQATTHTSSKLHTHWARAATC
jgi:hypothetical protein